MNNYVKKEIEISGKKLILETGELAVQANMAVKATYGDTVVLATATSAGPNLDLDYFPLTVFYEERLYASGTIKSSRFVKREGRPTDDAIVRRRLIDHAIRPLFPEDYQDEVQVGATILSLGKEIDPHILSIIAISAALHASNIPCAGPMVSAKVSYVNNQFIFCPTLSQIDESELDMLVSFVGEDKKFLALEGQANILPEEKILEAIDFARGGVDPILTLIKDFASAVNPQGTKYKYQSFGLQKELLNDVSALAKVEIAKLMGSNLEKTEYKDKRQEIVDKVFFKLEGKYKKVDMTKALSQIEEHALQHLILEEGRRPDGRKIDEIRKMTCKVGYLPRTHGSALFIRGVTQALTAVTLDSPTAQQIIQDMYGEDTKRYIHYYNFPPYSVGEVGRIGFSAPREIGHGMLAEKALLPVIPNHSEFPYMILLTSEILSSSGSSSMAATCGSTLALMDAGVPIKDMVAGVGVGLIVSEDHTRKLVMTDLAYMEDAYGFMDFKMTGTATGVTAIQCDMKLPGVAYDLLPKIFEQSKNGRLQVLEEMKKAIATPRAQVSDYAPKLVIEKIPVEKIGMVIGSGGKTIKEIEAKTGASLGIEPDGTVTISAQTTEGLEKARQIVIQMTRDPEIGAVYEGVVKGTVDFGAFVEILPGREGLLHVSELSHDYVTKVEDYVKVGDTVKVKVLNVENGKIALSKKALEAAPPGSDTEERPARRPFNQNRGRGGRRGS